MTTHDEDPGTCPDCGEAFELVRPGKSQPTCDCANICPDCGSTRRHFAVGDISRNKGGILCPVCDADAPRHDTTNDDAPIAGYGLMVNLAGAMIWVTRGTFDNIEVEVNPTEAGAFEKLRIWGSGIVAPVVRARDAFTYHRQDWSGLERTREQLVHDQRYETFEEAVARPLEAVAGLIIAIPKERPNQREDADRA